MHLATTGPSVTIFSFDPEPSGYISDQKLHSRALKERLICLLEKFFSHK
jgi:hypothetical protein